MKEADLCEKCEGCTLCVSVCPVSAIKLKKNVKGFYVPDINKDKCIDCKKCLNTCERKAKDFQEIKTIWAAKIKNNDDLHQSSSGGMFSVFSDYFLKKKGCVYGAILDDEFRVIHKKANNIHERNEMRGSKYVQSYLGEIFKSVEIELLDGKYVMFTGTPCQVDALQIYMESKKVSRANLFTCELICNGVSSPEIWSKYINDYIGKNKIQDVKFRFKHPQINGSIFAVIKKNGRVDVSGYYSQLYTSKLCMNEACYECNYTRKSRVADVTIGDLQGTIGENVSEKLKKESSIVLINSDKGKKIWESVKEKCEVQQLGIDYTQERLEKSCKKPKKYEQFWQDYQKISIRKLLKKYTNKSLIEDVRCVKNSIKI